MRRWHQFALEVSIALMLAGWGCSSLAADVVVGSVLAARGDVFLDAGVGPQPVAVKAPVHLGETIVTGTGKAKISLNDGSVISIGENSRVRLASYAGTAARAKVSIDLVSGVLRPFVAKGTSTGKFEIETETAIAAVRGTDWVIEATPEKTSVACLRGVVAVSGRSDPQTTVVLGSPGQGTDVRRGSSPTPAAPWGIKRLADILARATFD